MVHRQRQGGRSAPNAVEAFDDYTRKQVEIYQLYEATCQREGVVDFAELLLRSHEVLGKFEALREHYNARFKHILVDEFRDTNTRNTNGCACWRSADGGAGGWRRRSVRSTPSAAQGR